MARWATGTAPPGGWTVEVVQLAVGERLRIRHYGHCIADATLASAASDYAYGCERI